MLFKGAPKFQTGFEHSLLYVVVMCPGFSQNISTSKFPISIIRIQILAKL